jgi:hypothetical protein
MWTPARRNDGTPARNPVGLQGLGWTLSELRGHRIVSQAGGIPGFSAQLSRFVDDRLTVIVLANRDGADPRSLAHEIAAPSHKAGVATGAAATPDTPNRRSPSASVVSLSST